MDQYPIVNRGAVIITPKSPFREWVSKIGEVDNPVDILEMADSNLYLIPGYESVPDIHLAIENYIENNYEEIFLNELEDWTFDSLTFPEISYERFKEWFSVSVHTMVFDTVSGKLKRE